MRVLYFAPEYYVSHGGRTHARSFFKELAADPRVTYAELFPPGPGSPSHSHRAENSPPSAGRALAPRARSLAGALYRRPPLRLAEEMELLRPSMATYQALSAALTHGKIDAAVLRLDGRFRYVERLRRDHPQCRLCLEYNATPLDERLKGIPGERFWRREEVRQLAMADYISVVSDYLRRYLLSLDPSLEDKVFVNPNGADPEAFPRRSAEAQQAARANARRLLGAPDDAFVLGYVGGMEEWRRLPQLVSWAGKARRSGLDRLFLALIGSGADLQQVRAIIGDDANGLSGHAFCLGSWLPAEEVPSLMAGFDCGLLSFQHPHCCQQKAFEYLLAEVPVIGPTGSIPSGLASDGYGTFEFRPDFEGFLQTLKGVHDDLDNCRAAAARGRELVAAQFTWKANASRIVDALEKPGAGPCVRGARRPRTWR